MIEILCRTRGAWCALAAFPLILGATCSALAQASPNWTVTDACNCWSGWNNNFLTNNQTTGIEWFSSSTNGSSNFGPGSGLWQEVNMLQTLEDAYWHGYYNYQPNFDPLIYMSEINGICKGVTNYFPNQWMNAKANDSAPNDDLMWAAVAFARAYEITNNLTWLKEATNAFGIVWNRAQMGNPPNAALYGLGQAQNAYNNPTNPCPAVDFNAVIAGYWLADAYTEFIPNPTLAHFYTNSANTIYDWATNVNNVIVGGGVAFLCDPLTGKVNATVREPGQAPGSESTDYSMNYGTAMWAAILENDVNTCTNIVQYLATKFVGATYTYNGAWTDPGLNNETFHNLPDYYDDSGKFFGGLTNNNAGFNSIAFRGLGQAWHYMTSWQQTWAQEEVEAGFYHRCATNQLMWGDLLDNTPTTPSYGSLFSWDCNSQVAGILDIPPPFIVNINPTNIVFGVTNNQLSLSWPADHIGWQLQAQTNSVSTGLNTNWVNVSGSATTNRVIVPVCLTNGCVFYRLVFP